MSIEPKTEIPSLSFNPLIHPSCLEFPEWLVETAWAEHVPFAMYSISVIRPRVLVELGSYRGVSYCAFCQAVKSVAAATACFAVDTWEGDPHSGSLESEALAMLKAHHDPRYSKFSTLLQSTFDEALERFEDKSVDLLHIDGYHTYEAVNHDFFTWQSKLSRSGIVLFHDTEVRERDFGVWKFWAELKEQYPSFEFHHGYGLGVLAVGPDIPAGLRFLFEENDQENAKFREFFHQLGSRVSLALELAVQQRKLQELEEFREQVNQSRPLRICKKILNEGIVGYIKGHPRFSKN